ncbi:MAG: DUF4976 domain-containing protein, partial [Candidatus Hydrogenedentota bacterium]
IGRLLRWMDEAYSDSSFQPFIRVTSDHGETLDELQREFSYVFANGKFLNKHAIEIPLIMSYKNKIPQGIIRDTLVESLDISPTIVDILFAEEFTEFSGTSIKKCIFDESSPHKPYAFVHRRPFRSPELVQYRADLVDHAFAVVSKEYKLIEYPISGFELYDLANDSSEQTNLIKENEGIARDLERELRKWKEEYPFTNSDFVIPEDTRDILKSLGYLP